MRTVVQSSGQRSPGGDLAAIAVQLLDVLKRGVLGRLLPLPGEAQATVEADLLRQRSADPSNTQVADDLTSLAILRAHAIASERRWQERLAQGFDGWPHPPARRATDDAFSLVSDDELHSQLVGQPVIEALDRRFTDVLDVIDSRLWSLAVPLGARVRPANPVGSRAIVDAWLHLYPGSECSTALRVALLRQLERLAGERFGELYAWTNKQLSDAGFAVTRAGDFAMLMASPLGEAGAAGDAAVDGAHRQIWSEDNALAEQHDATWREGKRERRRVDGGSAPHDAERGSALRQMVRMRREAAGDDQHDAAAPPRRELRNEEFVAVLSLLQGDADAMRRSPSDAADAGLGGRLRDRLRQGAARLGMDAASTRFSGAQDDAIDLAGLVFDAMLGTHDLQPDTRAWLERLVAPYLRLAISDPYLFDDPDHPAHAWLSLLLAQADAPLLEGQADAPLLEMVEDSIETVVNEYHGEVSVFVRALAALQAMVEPRRQRADIAERRAWQSVQGRERLQAARHAADEALAWRLDGNRLLGSVATFLDDQWRQSLIHAWLREGPQSQRYRDALAVGDAIVAVDMAAAQAQGREVAQGLIELQQPLRDCYVACGFDESGAHALLAALVSELSRPDAKRQRHGFTRLADPDSEALPPATGDGVVADGMGLQVGQLLVLTEPGQAPRALRVAWTSPLTGRYLLVNRQGARHALLDDGQLAAMVEAGVLRVRPLDGAVEHVLRDLSRQASG